MKKVLEATAWLNQLPRITEIPEGKRFNDPVLLCPSDQQLMYFEDGSVCFYNPETALMQNQKELIEIIDIEDALQAKFLSRGIFAPRKFAESRQPIPTHISTQCIFLTKVKQGQADLLNKLIERHRYGKTDYDNMWLRCNRLDQVIDGDVLMILNRRTGGWDGSPRQPVIELLAAGGHIPCHWTGSRFEPLSPVENLKKEISEELGFYTESQNLPFLGGFHNEVSNELVMLYAMVVNAEEIPDIQEGALGNLGENIDGIYLAGLTDIMMEYKRDAAAFAGGVASAKTNFPSQTELMRRLYQFADSL